MPKTINSYACSLSTLLAQCCGLPVHATMGKLFVTSSLYTKYIKAVVYGAYNRASYTPVFTGFSQVESTTFYTIFNLLLGWLYTLSTPPITTRVFLKNHIFISKQGATL